MYACTFCFIVTEEAERMNEDSKAFTQAALTESFVQHQQQEMTGGVGLPQIESVDTMTNMEFAQQQPVQPQPIMMETPVTYSTEEVPYTFQQQQQQQQHPIGVFCFLPIEQAKLRI